MRCRRNQFVAEEDAQRQDPTVQFPKWNPSTYFFLVDFAIMPQQLYSATHCGKELLHEAYES